MKRFLQRLGVEGWTYEEDLLMAGAVGRFPVLFVGPSGTAKTMAAERIGRALELGYAKRGKHYSWAYRNVSTAQVEDLVGYPVPPPMDDVAAALKDGRTPEMVFVNSPDSLRDARLLVADEISRADPMTQNRWFSLINERRVDGVDLDIDVVYGAMNPPGAYEGSEVLDRAFAERFALVVRPPSLWEIDDAGARRSLIATRIKGVSRTKRAGDLGAPIDDDLAEELVHFIEAARAEYARVASQSGSAIVDYVEAVSRDINHQLGLRGKNSHSVIPGIDGRRASFMAQSLCALHAVTRTRQAEGGAKADLVGDAIVVLRSSFVHDVVGDRQIPDNTVVSAHNNNLDRLKSKTDRLMAALDDFIDGMDKVSFVLANDFDDQTTGSVIASVHNEMSKTSTLNAAAFSVSVLSKLTSLDDADYDPTDRVPRHVLEELAADLHSAVSKAKPQKLDLGTMMMAGPTNTLLGAMGYNNAAGWAALISGGREKHYQVVHGMISVMTDKLNNPKKV